MHRTAWSFPGPVAIHSDPVSTFLRELPRCAAAGLRRRRPATFLRMTQAPGEHLQPSPVLLALDVVVRSPWKHRNAARRRSPPTTDPPHRRTPLSAPCSPALSTPVDYPCDKDVPRSNPVPRSPLERRVHLLRRSHAAEQRHWRTPPPPLAAMILGRPILIERARLDQLTPSPQAVRSGSKGPYRSVPPSAWQTS